MTETRPQKQMHRPFNQVVEAIIFSLPDSNKNKDTLVELLTRIAVEETDKERQWRMLSNALNQYMQGAPLQLKQKIIQILRDPTEYRYVLKAKEKKEMIECGDIKYD